jgi:hypothetical protein
LQEARTEDGIALLLHDQPAHQRHPRPLLGGHRGLLSRWQVRAHRHPEEPRRGHHPHQRGGAGSDRLLPRQAGNGLQGIAALLDPDLHEGVDPLGGYHQEHLLPLLSQNICDAAGGGRDRHPHHPEHHGAQEYYDHTAVYQGSGCQQTGSQQKNHPDAEEMTGGFRPGLTDKVRFLFENRTKRVIVSVTAVTITLFFVTIRNYDYNFTSVTITNSCGYG